jgi:uncharacterized protein
MNRYEELKNYLKKYKRIMVAFSGGIDSYFILKAAVDSIGIENVLAVTGDSPSLKSAEKEQTNILAKEIGAEHKIIFTEEMLNPDYYNNPGNRCFFCKDELFTKLEAVKNELKYDAILDGTNYDDMSDYRPGYKASRNHGISSPLVELKFTKQEIRDTAKELGLTIWNKPSSPCLSSRIPYGQKVTVEKLSLIEQAEDVLKQFGFKEYRVRHFEIPQNGNVMKLAKIDVSKEEMKTVLNPEAIEEINNKLKAIGYDIVTMDMGGLKSGSLNLTLSVDEGHSEKG